nr:hypothetical protein [Tanacetum cinerariifolium]
MINKSGVAKSFPESFSQRGLNGELCFKRIDFWMRNGMDFTDLKTKIMITSEESDKQTRGAGFAGGGRWKVVGVVGSGENGGKMWKRKVAGVGGKHCTMYSVLKTWVTGETRGAGFAGGGRWKVVGVVGSGENGRKMWKRRVAGVGGKHCTMYSVLKTWVTGETMSSPNHPTSNIKDAFSSNFLDYLSASPDYVSASSEKTYSSSSNSFGIVLIASPSLFLFHDEPYMKVMHAYYAEKLPIPPSIITPPSLMPNPQEFFLPEELLSPKKQGHDQSSSSTSTLPQAFEIGESSRKTSQERHEEQIEGILNHLDEIYLDRIEHIDDKIEGLGQGRVVIK